MGEPQASVPAAVDAVTHLQTRVLRKSALYATPCMPVGYGPDYVNAVFFLETDLGAQALLDHLHTIEARFGRERRDRWGARTMDLDLIAYGDLVMPDRDTWSAWADLPEARRIKETPDQLILPHPRMQDRGFVLVPLCEIAPDWRHPVTGRRAREMRDALPVAEQTGPKPLT